VKRTDKENKDNQSFKPITPQGDGNVSPVDSALCRIAGCSFKPITPQGDGNS